MGDNKNTILKNYVGLVVVIILWVCIWSFVDATSKLYFKEHHTKRIRFMFIAIIVFSVILIQFFPEQMML
jgi:hypothetical protein